jgi:hypothetical protein
MNGTELYRRVVSTVQEMHLKIGDSHGSVSLYYPFQGDFTTLQEEFRECSKEAIHAALWIIARSPAGSLRG